MRVKSTLLAGFLALTTTLATPTRLTVTPSLVERDSAAIVSKVAQINDQVLSLGSDIAAYTGGDTSAIEATSTQLVALINEGTQITLAGEALTGLEAIDLVNPILALTSNVDTTISALIDKKSLVVAAGSGPSVYAQLTAQLAAANGFAQALSSKVPAELEEVANELSAGIAASIQKGIDAYADYDDDDDYDHNAQHDNYDDNTDSDKYHNHNVEYYDYDHSWHHND
ncbi:cell wall galactomannoprotein Mp2/allergen F17-like [Aspergillus terreus]|uniref:Cell wall mannoprotein 1 n=1 Tax=Aspergillus terreus TaxID=33178 RepID=A0A5M3YST9_ASPTE|nr:hypothetical protein ATETN484_0003024000 [Aspergillus terreus]GFF14231.1 cell wall galactomannoprotein Mp2/allergen F17-like [Aspergillus terreus]